MHTRLLVAAAVVGTVMLIGWSGFADRQSVIAGPKEDEQSIRQATDAYMAAFNKGNADAVLAFWAADAEQIDEAGTSIKGKEALTPIIRNMLADGKRPKLKIKTGTLRLFGDVAFQDGTGTMTWPDGTMDCNNFSAVWTRKDGKWLLSMVRDTAPVAEDEDATPALVNGLEWLVGDWSYVEKDMKTTVGVKWMKGRKFLSLELAVAIKGEETMSLTQVIGFDPSSNQIHSWFFDSRGGFGEGYWSRRGDTWTVEVAGLTAQAKHGTGTNIYKRVDADTFTFEAIDRELAGNALPDVKVTYARAAKAK